MSIIHVCGSSYAKWLFFVFTKTRFICVLTAESSQHHQREIYYPFISFFCQIVLICHEDFFKNLLSILSFPHFPMRESLLLLLSKDWTRHHFRFYFLLKPYQSVYFKIFFLFSFIVFLRLEEKDLWVHHLWKKIWIGFKCDVHVTLLHIYFQSRHFHARLI